jgi:hypothetical protein
MTPKRSSHENSLASFWAGEAGAFQRREWAILGWMQFHLGKEVRPATTDRQVAFGLGYQERNAVSPRITRLIKQGVIEQSGSTICPITGKRVRLIRITSKPAKQGELAI